MAWLLGPVAVVALALLAFGWLTLRDVAPVVTWLDIGSPGDDPYITGAFPPERNPSETYRWTYAQSAVRIPVPSDGRYRIELAIAATGAEPRRLQLGCPGGETTVTVAEGQTPPVVTLDCEAAGDIPVTISVPETRVPRDGRPLGIALRDVRVTAIDDGLTAAWRLRVGLMAAAALVGLWFAVTALAGGRVAGGVLIVAVVAAFGASLLRPEWIGPLTAGPAGLVALAAGYAAWLLRGSRRIGPLAVGGVALACPVIVAQPHLVKLLPALWTPNDSAAWRLLPILAALTIVASAVIDGRRAPLIVAAATLTALGTMLVPFVARAMLDRWSLLLVGPDWIDVATPVGAALLAATIVCVLAALVAVPRSALPPLGALVVVTTLALSILLTWRLEVMNFNGDEPHYYVTAHSIAHDADLELLDDYVDPEYQRHTISPNGNISVARASDVDRYVSFAPPPDDARLLLPVESTGLSTPEPPGLSPDGNAPAIVVGGAQDRDALPALAPGEELAIPISGPCSIASLLLGLPDAGTTSATVRLVDASGGERWHQTVELGDGVTSLQLPLDSSICTPGYVGTVSIASERPVIAEAIDTAAGLRIIPARLPASTWLLGPLPRDRFATLQAVARLTVHNPGTRTVETTISVLTPNQSLLRVTRVTIPPGATIATNLDLRAAAAVAIDAADPVVVTGAGWLPGGSYPFPELSAVESWTVTVPPGVDRDAGLWLALANDSAAPRTVVVQDAGAERTIIVCGFCADMVHIPLGTRAREVSVLATGGRIAVAAVAYEERTSSLHFDLGLPILAALPVRLGGPAAAPAVSAVLTILLAVGLAGLLGRVGVERRLAAAGAGVTVLLAPLSPYAVRFYSEPLAACLIVWSLLCWDRGRTSLAFAAVSLGLAGLLPLVHGRNTPVAIILALLALRACLRHTRASKKQLLILASVAAVFGALVVVSPLAVALRERATAGYFSTQWVPHNLLGILFDRGSGLIPFAPWCLLALAVRRPLHPLQRAAIVLFAVQLSVVALRAGGWQTFGAPGRYILPAVPLLALLAVPGAIRLWTSSVGRLVVGGCLGWSALATILLHWLPLSGYIANGQYFIDDVRREIPLLAPFDLFPTVAPDAGSNLLGLALLLVLWTIVTVAVRRSNIRIWP